MKDVLLVGLVGLVLLVLLDMILLEYNGQIIGLENLIIAPFLSNLTGPDFTVPKQKSG